jgi:hypothetical protein
VPLERLLIPDRQVVRNAATKVAWLEALFRLADCAASASPEEGDNGVC